MTEQQQDPAEAKKQHEATHGSKLAQAFGYVTAEDRQKWQQQRDAKAKVGGAKQSMNNGVRQAMRLSQQGVNARTQAAAYMDAQNEQSQLQQPQNHDPVDDYYPMDYQ